MKHICFSTKWTQHYVTPTVTIVKKEIYANPALSSSGTGPRCESTRQHTNDTTQPKYEFMTELRVQRKKNIKSKKKFLKEQKGSLKFAKKEKYTQKGVTLAKKENFST